MRCWNLQVLVQKYYKIDFGGKKLYFDGGSRKHHYAHSVCEVVCSGIGGIDVGDKVLVSYQAFGNFDDLNSVEISWHGRDRVGFVIGQDHILGVVRDGDFEALGDNVVLSSYVGQELELFGVKYKLVEESDVLMVL